MGNRGGHGPCVCSPGKPIQRHSYLKRWVARVARVSRTVWLSNRPQGRGEYAHSKRLALRKQQGGGAGELDRLQPPAPLPSRPSAGINSGLCSGIPHPQAHPPPKGKEPASLSPRRRERIGAEELGDLSARVRGRHAPAVLPVPDSALGDPQNPCQLLLLQPTLQPRLPQVFTERHRLAG